MVDVNVNVNATNKPKRVEGARKTLIDGNNPKDRYGAAKVSGSVLPLSSLVVMSRAMMAGEVDYGFQNYRVEPVQARIYLDAAFRHLLAVMDGEDIDPKRGIHHLGFVMATVGIYLDALHHGNLIDNRVIAGRTGELISALNNPTGQQLTPHDLHEIYQAFLLTEPEVKYRLEASAKAKTDDIMYHINEGKHEEVGVGTYNPKTLTLNRKAFLSGFSNPRPHPKKHRKVTHAKRKAKHSHRR